MTIAMLQEAYMAFVFALESEALSTKKNQMGGY